MLQLHDFFNTHVHIRYLHWSNLTCAENTPSSSPISTGHTQTLHTENSWASVHCQGDSHAMSCTKLQCFKLFMELMPVRILKHEVFIWDILIVCKRMLWFVRYTLMILHKWRFDGLCVCIIAISASHSSSPNSAHINEYTLNFCIKWTHVSAGSVTTRIEYIGLRWMKMMSDWWKYRKFKPLVRKSRVLIRSCCATLDDRCVATNYYCLWITENFQRACCSVQLLGVWRAIVSV